METSERMCPGCGKARLRDNFRRNGYCGVCNRNAPPDCTCPPGYRDCRCGGKR